MIQHHELTPDECAVSWGRDIFLKASTYCISQKEIKNIEVKHMLLKHYHTVL